MSSSAAMSATVVLAKPRRRNSASAASMMRARVSSGLGFTFTTGIMGQPFVPGLYSDEFRNSSVDRSQPFHGLFLMSLPRQGLGGDPLERQSRGRWLAGGLSAQRAAKVRSRMLGRLVTQ